MLGPVAGRYGIEVRAAAGGAVTTAGQDRALLAGEKRFSVGHGCA
jgi:hypothetical protein